MELDSSSWLALALTPGLASRLPGRLLKEFGSLEEVFRAPFAAFGAIEVSGRSGASGVQEAGVQARRRNWFRFAGFENCRLVSWMAPEYPQTLLQVYDPPVLREFGARCR